MSRPNLAVFEDFFGASPLGWALCDMNDDYLRVNNAFADLIGQSTSEVLRLSYWNITPKEFAHQESIQQQRLSEQGALGPYEKELIHREGFRVPVSASGWLVESDGQKFILSVTQVRHARLEGGHQVHVDRSTSNRSGQGEWSEAKNARRCELIDRKIQKMISSGEAAELEDLQEALRAYLDRVAPIPMEGAKRLHAELMAREKKGLTQDASV
jgi:PAS domain S-box-containing protein